MPSGDLRIEYQLLDELIPNEDNPKLHDVDELAESVDRFGFAEAIVVDGRTGKLVAGHGRRKSLIKRRDAGEAVPSGVRMDRDKKWRVPVSVGWSSKDDEEALAFMLAANETTTRGGWDSKSLASILQRLDAGAGLTGTAFDRSTLTNLLARLNAAEEDKEFEVPLAPKQRITERGDVWLIGPHRVMCGDARDPDDVKALLGDLLVNLAVTSPPYADRREYDTASEFEPVPPDQYVEWFRPCAEQVAEHLAEDGSWLVNIKPGAEGLDNELYVLDLVVAHARQWGWHFATEFCWERSGVPKQARQRLKNQFEPVYQFVRGKWKFRPDNVRHLSEHAIMPPGTGNTTGRADWAKLQGQGAEFFTDRQTKRKSGKGYTGPMSEVQGHNEVGEWEGEGLAYPGNRLPTFSSTHEATGHSAAFPVGLPAFFVCLFTDKDDVVYDPFLGSGSTILAAHFNERIACGMEISPAYIDIACKRIQRHTGFIPVRLKDQVGVDFQ